MLFVLVKHSWKTFEELLISHFFAIFTARQLNEQSHLTGSMLAHVLGKQDILELKPGYLLLSKGVSVLDFKTQLGGQREKSAQEGGVHI